MFPLQQSALNDASVVVRNNWQRLVMKAFTLTCDESTTLNPGHLFKYIPAVVYNDIARALSLRLSDIL